MSVVLSLALPLSSWAFAPGDEGERDLKLEPVRIFYQNHEEQGRLLAAPGWRRFAAGEGSGWNARFDETTQTPRWMWGRGIPMPGARDDSPERLTSDLSALLQRHSDLLGFEPGMLVLRSANYVERLDTWYVEFDNLREGLPTYRGGISARIKHGKLIHLRVATAPRAAVTGSLQISSAEAVERAISAGPVPAAHHTERSAEPILLEHVHDGTLKLRTTWMVRTVTGPRAGVTSDPPGIWVSFVDGESGALINVHNEVRFSTIEANHHARTVDGSALVTSPVPYAYVGNNSDLDTTDVNGNYSLSGGGPYATELNGTYLYVNDNGTDGYLSESDPDMTWTTASATQAEIDSYIFLHQVKAWGEATAPEVAWVAGAIQSNVNLNDVCNAYFDGYAVNFFNSGSGCSNTGQIADVNYHEWGHGFHYYSLQAGVFDGSLSEGAGDTVSTLLTHDRYMAPYFYTSGGAIRDLGPDQVYPNDFINNNYYVHYNGLIFGGAMYDLLELLMDDEGETQGQQQRARSSRGCSRAAPPSPTPTTRRSSPMTTTETSATAPLTSARSSAFGRHGLGEGASSGGGVLVSHDPLASMPEGTDYPVSVDLVSLSAGCQAVGADSATVHYRVNGKSWKDAPLFSSGTIIEGEIPEQDEYSIIEYYITGTSDDGEPFSSPGGGEINPYTFFVGDALEIRCDDFEDDDGDYKHTLLSGVEEDGADDWQWGTPTGSGGDPSGAADGVRAWGNDLGFTGYNGLYKPAKGNRLRSPKIDTKHYTNVFLSYSRWLQIEDNTYDQAIVSIDDEPVWSNWDGSGDEHHLDGQWVTHVVSLNGRADQDEVRVAFELYSDEGLEFGGWTVDDICLLAPATPDNRLGITDFVVDRIDDVHAELTFTTPAHRPLEEIRVVRRIDRFPEDHEDGDIAWEDDDPDLDDEIEIEDENGYSGTTYYAVFASDGDDWLSSVRRTGTQPASNSTAARSTTSGGREEQRETRSSVATAVAARPLPQTPACCCCWLRLQRGPFAGRSRRGEKP